VVARCPGCGSQGTRHPDRAQPGAPPPAHRGRALAADPLLGPDQRHGGHGGPGLRPQRTAVVACSTDPPDGSTPLCLHELGPVIPRTFSPAPGWSRTGHRIKALLDYGRGLEKVWVYGALRVREGQEVTFTAPSRNTAGYLTLLKVLDEANADGDLNLVSDNLSSHTSAPIQAWLATPPRVHPVPLPTGACWLHRQEGWWRLFRRAAFAGQSFADAKAIDRATRVATPHRNARAKPWIWGRPPPPHRRLRRRFVYCL
jgi:DDE superfamily endonuclease